uniref:Peptidase_S8 domain-containing protein n=1 Tax=Panagrellus redivivus TaxID=6233 RepID=A0A7E4VPF7_PANRE
MLFLLIFVVTLLQTGVTAQNLQTESNSLLISYDGYYDTPTRKAILEEAQPQIIGRYIIEKRNNLFSDFDLIHGACLEASRFLAHKRIVKVSENHVQHFRQPLATSFDSRTSKHLDIRQITDLLRADRLWANGFTGKGIDVAVFDTGLTRRRAFFRNVKDVRDFTNDGNPADKVGHGTFVAGLIASSRKSCSGIAPRANLHIYKVFTKDQVSSTAWFLDAFNAALQANVNIINLSIGGPDFTDQPFMDKVREVTAAGIIIVSAIGNDGPAYGTLNNPADQGDVIGVGGINIEDHVSRFSSRGMTTWELPSGYGRVKPDLVAYGVQVFGAAINGGCRVLSGTSVAAPVVTGALALILSSVPPENRRNVAMIKQILLEGAKRLETPTNMFEQGAGRLDLPSSFYHIQKYSPKISIFPSYIDYLECPYMWPWCSQPVYHTGLPVIFNLTLYNGFGTNGEIIESPVFEALESDNAGMRRGYPRGFPPGDIPGDIPIF